MSLAVPDSVLVRASESVGLAAVPRVGLSEDPDPASSPWNTLVNVNKWSYAWPRTRFVPWPTSVG